jgi:hypothetical protein
MTTKLVLVFIDQTGVELTGRYLDRYFLHRETRTTPEAKACIYSDDTPKRVEQLENYVASEKANHDWMGWFRLPNRKDILALARSKALIEFNIHLRKRSA